MESSDDSCVWTDASSAKSDGDDSSTEDTMKEKHYESESEKKYKKKLHKKLFKSEPEIKHELLNGDRVKHEADSDAPAPLSPPAAASPLKRKRKRERSPSPDADAKPALDYLDARVKQEHLVPTSDSQDEPHKKKKAKKKKERKESNEMIIEDKFTAEETIIEMRPERNASTSINIDIDNEPAEKISKKEKKKKKKKRKDSIRHDSEDDSSMMEVTQNDNDASVILTQDTYENNLEENNDRSEKLNDSANNRKLKTSTSKSTKISDHLQFEDGEDVIAACEAMENKVSAQSSKLRRFLKANPHLHSLTSTPNTGDPLISQDDDIWLLNCPHEMNISSLKGTNLSLDNKCKVKIDSQTFIGNVECEVNRAAILTFEHSRPVIKSLVINGIVNFHKRIPKAHYLEDNIISNNQTDFISLPDTKCRHPLFGPDYKKAIKIPAAVKSRLENPPLEPPPVPREGKKKKKRKYEDMGTSEDTVDGGGGEREGEGGERRERKRRRSERDPDQPVKKKAKRIKQEQESTETWDSEKAIEENLFNF